MPKFKVGGKMVKSKYPKKSGKGNEELNTELAEINQRLEELNSDGSGILEEGFAIFGQYSKTLPTALDEEPTILSPADATNPLATVNLGGTGSVVSFDSYTALTAYTSGTPNVIISSLIFVPYTSFDADVVAVAFAVDVTLTPLALFNVLVDTSFATFF